MQGFTGIVTLVLPELGCSKLKAQDELAFMAKAFVRCFCDGYHIFAVDSRVPTPC